MLENNAIVTDIKEITKNIKEFTVKLNVDAEPFKAGQFCVLGLTNSEGKFISRSYSIASKPSVNTRVFYIVLVEDGQLTPLLFNLKRGDGIFMSPRGAGHMVYDHFIDSKNLLFCATGTGIAPFRSILDEYEADLKHKHIHLLHGVRYKQDLGYKDYFEKLEKKYPNFKYYPVVSREDWEGKRGYIVDLFENEKEIKELIEDKNLKVMMCGNPKMVETTVGILDKHGITEDSIIKEEY